MCAICAESYQKIQMYTNPQGGLMEVLMSPPTYYKVAYSINPWMDPNTSVDQAKAMQQWQHLKEVITDCGAQVHIMDAQPNYYDLVFTANAAFCYEKTVCMAQFKYPERQKETQHAQNWFENNNYRIIEPTSKQKNCSFEGEGDLLYKNNQLYAGWGLRTDKAYFSDLEAVYNIGNLLLLELTNPHFYHLDTCLFLLNDKQAIIYADAFNPADFEKLKQKIDCFEVTKKEAHHLACNTLIINDKCIMPSDCPDTSAWIKAQGYSTHECDMSEFLKSGGATKCCVLELYE